MKQPTKTEKKKTIISQGEGYPIDFVEEEAINFIHANCCYRGDTDLKGKFNITIIIKRIDTI